MANEEKKDAKPGTSEQPSANPVPPAPAGKAEAKPDLVTEIGTLTYPRAATHFGKDRALAVMRKVAEIGGHGLFEDEHFLSPIFGGLAMPSPEKVAPPQKEAFENLPEWEFHFQAALEEHETVKLEAAKRREAINDFYLSLK